MTGVSKETVPSRYSMTEDPCEFTETGSSQMGPSTENTAEVLRLTRKLFVTESCLHRDHLAQSTTGSADHTPEQALCSGFVGQHKKYSMFCFLEFCFLIFRFWHFCLIGL